MEKLLKIRKALIQKLEESETAHTGELSGSELSPIHELTATIKNLDEICMMEDGSYSQDGGYGRGISYANRGQHYVRGHYSRDGGMDRYSSRRDSRGRYSRDDGRSEMMEHLEMALDSATEQDREAVRRFMRQFENA